MLDFGVPGDCIYSFKSYMEDRFSRSQLGDPSRLSSGPVGLLLYPDATRALPLPKLLAPAFGHLAGKLAHPRESSIFAPANPYLSRKCESVAFATRRSEI